MSHKSSSAPVFGGDPGEAASALPLRSSSPLSRPCDTGSLGFSMFENGVTDGT